MPCFKGLAVSIHTPNGPLAEYSVQRHSRASRIACYIPVPPPKLPNSATGKPEQSTFAISITLLTPGLTVPYSTPKATPDNPYPRPKIVGGLPDQPTAGSSIGPYQPMTASPRETVAAYIYFDGRQKEEVATLLRRGEETWVNSRWVGVPQSEGGGLAEREFLFREVGLERWLNGLDLEGKDAAEKIERRRQKMEKRRRKRELQQRNENAANAAADEGMDLDDKKPKLLREKGVLRYGANDQSPVEQLSDDAELLSTDSDFDDDPIPETAGQIKVALFRVLASGEIKRGEYSPQFDAHDDDEDLHGGPGGGQESNGNGSTADIDHTTSFAKPKSLDPKSISTQTVTGIDPTDKPYAVFTFMYRGERQLQKMGILKDPKSQDKESLKSARRKSTQPDFANIKPLKPGGTTGFVGFRDREKEQKTGKRKGSNGNELDSDDDEDDEGVSVSIVGKAEDEEEKEGNSLLSPDDAKRQGELAEGVRQIKLKRQHSAEPLSAAAGLADPAKASKSSTPGSRLSPPVTTRHDSTPPHSSLPKETSMNLLDNDAYVGSPLKKQRASISATDDNVHRQGPVTGLSSKIHEIMDTTATATSATAGETQNSQSSITNHNTSTTTANNDSLGGSLLSEGIMQSDIKSPGLEEEL
ncbi:hypothetical protein TRV_04523 [Trichophyton verrucosum HKI 0517]|uniref:DUF7918 domain-containing protein n=1 Tax=Trichophyton verrucosum (strain HKI 0517) TaxID=663202 RepID=D4DBM3_TRIVH|nr:uncharacterized protein TRV_04523 [Trichophyton verrucosum HKI 0517]EFE40750.1 hypothetical protein TRV_04523 [Trichophyton verrucosum HKI 0517]